jgi:hypothetical protein
MLSVILQAFVIKFNKRKAEMTEGKTNRLALLRNAYESVKAERAANPIDKNNLSIEVLKLHLKLSRKINTIRTKIIRAEMSARKRKT